MTSIHRKSIPIVMSFSAHDPSGAGGIQADIETIGSLHCHCTPIITALTTQDTVKVESSFPTPESLLIRQARMILEDIPIAAFKIGMLGSEENAVAVHTLLRDYPQIPVILDATLITYDVQHYENARLQEALRQMIIPQAHIMVINPKGAQYLAGHSDTLDAAAHQLMESGAEHVLLTGMQHKNGKWWNGFFGNFRLLETFAWERSAQEFQGEGSTMTAAIAAFIAQGTKPVAAVHQAQEYTHSCLKHGYRIGMGRHLPNRLYSVRESFVAYDARHSPPSLDKKGSEV